MPEQSCIFCRTTYDVPYGIRGAVDAPRGLGETTPPVVRVWAAEGELPPNFTHGPPTLLHSCRRVGSRHRPIPQMNPVGRPRTNAMQGRR